MKTYTQKDFFDLSVKLKTLDAERDRVVQELKAAFDFVFLKDNSAASKQAAPTQRASGLRRRRRKMSAAARARISAAMKATWAKRKKKD